MDSSTHMHAHKQPHILSPTIQAKLCAHVPCIHASTCHCVSICMVEGLYPTLHVLCVCVCVSMWLCSVQCDTAVATGDPWVSVMTVTIRYMDQQGVATLGSVASLQSYWTYLLDPQTLKDAPCGVQGSFEDSDGRCVCMEPDAHEQQKLHGSTGTHTSNMVHEKLSVPVWPPELCGACMYLCSAQECVRMCERGQHFHRHASSAVLYLHGSPIHALSKPPPPPPLPPRPSATLATPQPTRPTSTAHPARAAAVAAAAVTAGATAQPATTDMRTAVHCSDGDR